MHTILAFLSAIGLKTAIAFVGILLDLETDQLEEASESFAEAHDKIMKDATGYLNKLLAMENTVMEHYKVHTTVIDGKR